MRKFIVFVIISVLSFGAYALTEAELWRLLNTEYKIGPGKEEARQGQAFARDYDIPEDLGRRLVASFSISDVHLPSLIQQVLDIINQKEGRKTNQREDGRAQQREEKFASDASKKGETGRFLIQRSRIIISNRPMKGQKKKGHVVATPLLRGSLGTQFFILRWRPLIFWREIVIT